jgi:phi13 family phage major tail protein
MSLNRNLGEITEYRGVEGLVAARVLVDDNENGDGHGYVTGDVFSIAGVAEISRTTESSNESHYYDNMAAIVISSTGADEVSITTSALPFEVLAEITGQVYDSTKGAFIEGGRETRYFALGYKTKKTNGDEVYVWRLKGTFNIPDQTNTTENDGTDAKGQELTFTGISTTHKFAAYNNKGAKALNVDVAKGLADVSTFFNEVTDPDSLTAATAYSLTITQAQETTVTVKKGATTLASGATLHSGDVITISVTGGTITVNGTAFTSGSTLTVSGNVAVVSTASAAG